jgi:chromosome segregation ATPase
MKKKLSILCLIIGLTNAAHADDAKLKQMLQTLTGRLRAAETERNNLLSDKAQLEQEKKTLSGKVDSLTKQAADDKAKIDNLSEKKDAQEKELGDTKESLTKWKGAYDQLQTAAKKSESERSRLAGEAIVLKRKVEDRERKNLELFRTANEILKRYERFGLGDALAAREPFTGITRVKLETLVQDYQDKIADNRVTSEETTVTTKTESGGK